MNTEDIAHQKLITLPDHSCLTKGTQPQTSDAAAHLQVTLILLNRDK